MPYQTVDGHEYALISFDDDGDERTDDPGGNGGLFSDVLLDRIGAEPITDIFFFCHGWKGDVPRAIEQYDEWVTAQVALAADVDAMAQRRPNFLPLRIGLHWPSQPWGDEDLGGDDFAPGGGASAECWCERYLEILGDAPGIRADLETIVAAARDNAAATELPPEVSDGLSSTSMPPSSSARRGRALRRTPTASRSIRTSPLPTAKSRRPASGADSSAASWGRCVSSRSGR